MEYEKITITRLRISGGFVLAIAIIILVATQHKAAGRAVNTALEILTWVAISVGVLCAGGISYLVYRLVRRARKGSYKPVKTVKLYPTYLLNSKPVAEIEPRRIVLDGIEYREVIDGQSANRFPQ